MAKNNDKKTTKKTVITTVATPQDLLALAIANKTDVEQLERLMALQERWQKQVSKKAFLEAMSKFQDICPPLYKKTPVGYNTKKGDVNYNFAEIGYIAQQIKASLRECGLSYRWEAEDLENGKMKITCIVSHIEGHSETNSMTAGKDATGAKNDIQQIGSTRSYAERYTLRGAFGLSMIGEDNDGQADEKTFTEDIKKEITEKLKNIKEKTKLNELNSKYKQFQDNPAYQELLMAKQAEIKKNKAFDQAQREEFVRQTIEGAKKEEMKAVLKENPDIMTNGTLKKQYNDKLKSFENEKV